MKDLFLRGFSILFDEHIIRFVMTKRAEGARSEKAAIITYETEKKQNNNLSAEEFSVIMIMRVCISISACGCFLPAPSGRHANVYKREG